MDRIELINRLCKRVNAKNYLEVGIREGEVISQVQVENRTGVDPRPLLEKLDEKLQPGLHGIRVHPCESDVFFGYNKDVFDVIFVDGLHLYEQAIKDILNGFNALSDGGYIVAHDLLPASEAEGGRSPKPGAWNGDVWKVMHDIHENYPEIRSVTVNSDFGMGILWLEHPPHHFEPQWEKGYPRMPFSVFESEKNNFMTIVEPDWALIEEKL